jgi:hypothetical protein
VAALGSSAKIGKPKALQENGFESAREAFGGLPEQVWRRAAENEKPCREWRPVGQDAQ